MSWRCGGGQGVRSSSKYPAVQCTSPAPTASPSPWVLGGPVRGPPHRSCHCKLVSPADLQRPLLRAPLPIVAHAHVPCAPPKCKEALEKETCRSHQTVTAHTSTRSSINFFMSSTCCCRACVVSSSASARSDGRYTVRRTRCEEASPAPAPAPMVTPAVPEGPAGVPAPPPDDCSPKTTAAWVSHLSTAVSSRLG